MLYTREKLINMEGVYYGYYYMAKLKKKETNENKRANQSDTNLPISISSSSDLSVSSNSSNSSLDYNASEQTPLISHDFKGALIYNNAFNPRL